MSILLSIKLQKSEKMSPDDHDKIKSPHLRKTQQNATKRRCKKTYQSLFSIIRNAMRAVPAPMVIESVSLSNRNVTW